MDRQVLHDFWKRFYYPGNATLYVVGDFDAGGGMDAAEQLIQDTFGKIPTGPQPGSGAPGPLRQQQQQQQQLVPTCSLLPSVFPRFTVGALYTALYTALHIALYAALHPAMHVVLHSAMHTALVRYTARRIVIHCRPHSRQTACCTAQCVADALHVALQLAGLSVW